MALNYIRTRVFQALPDIETIFEEYDEPKPKRGSYYSRLTPAKYYSLGLIVLEVSENKINT